MKPTISEYTTLAKEVIRHLCNVQIPPDPLDVRIAVDMDATGHKHTTTYTVLLDGTLVFNVVEEREVGSGFIHHIHALRPGLWIQKLAEAHENQPLPTEYQPIDDAKYWSGQ